MNENKKPTQVERIKEYLDDFGSITPLEALENFGIMRLASRMSELKTQGYPFEVETATSKNRYGETVHFARYKKIIK